MPSLDITQILIAFAVLLFSLTVHEAAHAWSADKLGDPTARTLGRVTFNPAAHVDPIGTILFPLLAMASSLPLIGWAKPVPVNPRKYRNYRAGDIRVSLAGIVTNLGLAVIATLLLIAIAHLANLAPALGPSLEAVARMVNYGVLVNLVLAFFNLIPIPPLDGSHVLYHLLPPQLGLRYRELSRYGMLILILLLMVGRPIFSVLMTPAWVLYQMAMNLVSLWT